MTRLFALEWKLEVIIPNVDEQVRLGDAEGSKPESRMQVSICEWQN